MVYEFGQRDLCFDLEKMSDELDTPRAVWTGTIVSAHSQYVLLRLDIYLAPITPGCINTQSRFKPHHLRVPKALSTMIDR
jgi:hypothetical protein